jgi:hypothetical protein
MGNQITSSSFTPKDEHWEALYSLRIRDVEWARFAALVSHSPPLSPSGHRRGTGRNAKGRRTKRTHRAESGTHGDVAPVGRR